MHIRSVCTLQMGHFSLDFMKFSLVFILLPLALAGLTSAFSIVGARNAHQPKVFQISYFKIFHILDIIFWFYVFIEFSQVLQIPGWCAKITKNITIVDYQ